MAEHSKFIRGLLDPTEEELFDIADIRDVFYADWKQDEGIHVVPLNMNKN